MRSSSHHSFTGFRQSEKMALLKVEVTLVEYELVHYKAIANAT